MGTSLRPELELPPLDVQKVEQLLPLVRQLVNAFETETPDEALLAELMAQHNAIVGHDRIEAQFYERLYSWTSEREGAELALLPKPPVVADITRAELVEIARRFSAGESERSNRFYLELFEANTPSGTSDLFHCPDSEWLRRIGTDEPSIEQIVDEALRPRSITL